jgi:arsenite-transporting ATPase
MTSLLPGLSEEFMVDHIRELGGDGDYTHIVWDTAPLGQTLVLLKTPTLLAEHLKLAPRIYSKLKVGLNSREPIMDIIERWKILSERNTEFLRNEVRFNLVTIPEALAVNQLDEVMAELRKFELEVSTIIINNVAIDDGSTFLSARSKEQEKYLKFIHQKYGNLDIIELPMFPYEIRGLERLKEVEMKLFRG